MARVEVIRNILRSDELEVCIIPVETTMADACPESFGGISSVGGWLNGSEVPRERWPQTPLGLADTVRFAVRPRGPVLAAIQIISAIAAAFTLARLFKGPARAIQRGDQDSPTYSFSGIGTSRVEGLPMPIILGRFRHGGQVINEFTISQGIPSSTQLYVLYSFGTGPVASVGKIVGDADGLTGTALPELTLNENPAENYDDVIAWVRQGSSEQAPIPSFGKLYNWLEVALGLRAKKTGNKDQSTLYVTGSPYTQDYDAQWDTYAETVDLTDVSDGFRARVLFESGLFTAEDDGSLGEAFFRCQFRYRELDAGNNPIILGGPNNDGWVRLAPEAFLAPSERSPFERDYEHAFLDPQTWVQGSTGGALHPTVFPNAYAQATVQVDYPHEDGSQILKWSASVWFRLLQALPATPSNGDELQIFGNWQGSKDAGFSLGFKYRTNLLGSQSSGWVLQARVGGTGNRTVVAESRDYDQRTVFALNTWYLLTLAYQSQADGSGLDRLTLYVNDYVESLRTTLQDSACTFRLTPATTQGAAIRFLRNHDTFGVNYVLADLDDAVLIEAELSASTVASRFADKTPMSHPTMVARWAFDDVVNHLGTTVQDVLVGGLSYFSGAILNNCTAGQTTGIVGSQPEGEAKRMKARVQILRLNHDSTHSDVFDDATLVALSPYTDAALSYPREPLLALQIRATEQLNSTRPEMSVEIEGYNLVPRWVSGTPSDPGFVTSWSSNPAWWALCLFTDVEIGLGRIYSIDDMILESFREVAERSDEVVYDGSRSDGPDYSRGWVDIIFDATTLGPDPYDPDNFIARGSLKFLYPSTDFPGLHFKRGRYIRPHDVPSISGAPTINVDGEVGGYEIARDVYWSGANASWVLEAYWDRLDEADPWTSGTHYQTHGTPAGSSTGGHRRFEVHGVIDIEDDAIEKILDVLAVARASFVREGGRIRLVQDAPLPDGVIADALLARGDIEDGSWSVEYANPRQLPNVYVFDFHNEDDLHKREPWTVYDPELENAIATSADDIRSESGFLWGVTNRAQVERQGRFMLAQNRLRIRSGRFSVGPAGTTLRPGDIALFAHDILPRGVSGRAMLDSAPNKDRIVLDHEFTLAEGEVYWVYVRDYLTDVVEGANVDFTRISPGSYPAGTVVFVTGGPDPQGGFTRRPGERLTPYVLVREGDELRGRIIETTLRSDLSTEVRWVEYRAEVYNDQATEVVVQSPFFGEGSGLLNAPAGSGRADGERPSDSLLVDGPTAVTVSDVMPRVRGLGRRPRLRVSWSWDPAEAARVASVRVFLRRTGGLFFGPEGFPDPVERSWLLAGEEQGPVRSMEVELTHNAEPGTRLEVAVQPVTMAGTRRRPGRCPRVVHTFRGRGRGPRPLSVVVTPEVDGSRVRYSWQTDPLEEDAVVEIRRGGWILGQRVYSSAPGEGGTHFLEDVAGAVGGGDPFRLYFAVRDSAGQYSDPTIVAWQPDLEVGADPFPADATDVAWEQYADGWKTDTLPPVGDPQLSGLVRHADGYLEFTGSGVDATYTTRDPSAAVAVIPRSLSPVRAILEAAVEAEQVHPLAGDDATWAASDPDHSRWTGEGPRYLIGGERNTTLSIEWRFTTDGVSWGSWARFRPGTYAIVDAQFRLVLTRPSSAFQVKVFRFHTRIRPLQRRQTDRSQREEQLSSSFWGR